MAIIFFTYYDNQFLTLCKEPIVNAVPSSFIMSLCVCLCVCVLCR